MMRRQLRSLELPGTAEGQGEAPAEPLHLLNSNDKIAR